MNRAFSIKLRVRSTHIDWGFLKKKEYPAEKTSDELKLTESMVSLIKIDRRELINRTKVGTHTLK